MAKRASIERAAALRRARDRVMANLSADFAAGAQVSNWHIAPFAKDPQALVRG
jgi:hypothetical protein